MSYSELASKLQQRWMHDLPKKLNQRKVYSCKIPSGFVSESFCTPGWPTYGKLKDPGSVSGSSITGIFRSKITDSSILSGANRSDTDAGGASTTDNYHALSAETSVFDKFLLR